MQLDFGSECETDRFLSLRMQWSGNDGCILVAQPMDDIQEMRINNLLAAYQNVRHADYGTSQAAERSLFK
jgi:hypothetical protein